jgi:hypothetical protein
VIHDDFDAREPSSHIFEHRHLMRQDVEIEHRAQSFRFTPQRIVRFRIEPLRVRTVQGAEAHALKAMLFYPIVQPLHYFRIFRVDQPVRHEPVRVLLKRVAYVRIVPSVIARINQHGQRRP